jgi:DNA adenine methylase
VNPVKPVKPLLKWAGGKARLAPQICAAFGKPCRGTYYEPFIGSGAVFLYRRAMGMVKDAVLSDANAKLVEVHRAVRDDVQGLLNRLDGMPQEDWRERYYEVREQYNEGPQEGVLPAARFIWLNRAGFNGLYRENKKGIYNVPVGQYTRLSIPKRAHFERVAELLRGVELVACGFEDIVGEAGEGDQVYCDPPYVPLSETANFTGYFKDAFGWDQQQLLRDVARRAAFGGAKVVLSNHDLPIVRQELYPAKLGFKYVARPRVARAISRKAASRKPVVEVIAAIGPLKARVA